MIDALIQTEFNLLNSDIVEKSLIPKSPSKIPQHHSPKFKHYGDDITLMSFSYIGKTSINLVQKH